MKKQKLEWQGGILESESEQSLKININGSSRTSQTRQETVAKKISGRCSLRIEKKGRGGSPATIIFNFSDPEAKNTASLKQLASDLKTKLACGGTIENNEILLTIQDTEKVKKTLSKFFGIQA